MGLHLANGAVQLPLKHLGRRPLEQDHAEGCDGRRRHVQHRHTLETGGDLVQGGDLIRREEHGRGQQHGAEEQHRDAERVEHGVLQRAGGDRGRGEHGLVAPVLGRPWPRSDAAGGGQVAMVPQAHIGEDAGSHRKQEYPEWEYHTLAVLGVRQVGRQQGMLHILLAHVHAGEQQVHHFAEKKQRLDAPRAVGAAQIRRLRHLADPVALAAELRHAGSIHVLRPGGVKRERGQRAQQAKRVEHDQVAEADEGERVAYGAEHPCLLYTSPSPRDRG